MSSFITGVDLEAHRQYEEQQLALLPKRAKRRPKPPSLPNEACLEDLDRRLLLQLEDKPKDALSKRSLLDNVDALKDDDDEMAEMWRRIRRTRQKMDSQTQILNGFLNDIDKIKRMKGSSDNSSTPRATALEDKKTSAARQLSLPCSQQNALGKQRLGAAGTRELPFRSASAADLAKSRSSPALAFEKLDSAPLALPARRAPPQSGVPPNGSSARRLQQGMQRSKSSAGI
jgi:hypothetical protein